MTLTIDRESSRNALNPQVMSELHSALDAAGRSKETRVVVITGAGDRAFCAGGDLSGSNADGPLGQHRERAQLSSLFLSMRRLGKPVLARVNGHALGGGFGLMLACDLVVAADHAEVGTPEVNIGLWPYIITSVIQRNLPQKLALEMMMLGKRVPAAEGMRWGFINEVVPRERLDESVESWTAALLSKSSAVLRLGKDSFYVSEGMDFESALRYLESQLTIGLSAEDAMEGISAFVQKRPPEWKHR